MRGCALVRHSPVGIRKPSSRSGTVRMVTLLASGALLGKLLGFARELLMARVFGASLIADSFRGALARR